MVRFAHEMLSNCLWFLAFGAVLLAVEALPARVGEDARKAAEKSAEPKGTLSDSGLEDTDTANDSKQQAPKAISREYMMEQAAPAAAPHPDMSYDVSSYYQEPRYKRELDLNPEEVFALLSLYDNERRNRGNWRNYENDDYESMDDESNMLSMDDEDPRGGSWLNSQMDYPQQPQSRYGSDDPLLNSELAVLEAARDRPSYYDQYQQYDGGVQYGKPQYGLAYEQRSYYPPENKFVNSRKRSQNYDSYGGRSDLMLNSRGYPGYQHRPLY